MHISKVQLVNYRNFKFTDIFFNEGINTIIGENGSGKSNLFRAIRLLLDDNMFRQSRKLDENDFHRSLGNWRGHWIIISIEFDKVSQDEAIQSLFLHGVGNIENGTIGRATYNLIFRPKALVRVDLSKLKPGDTAGLSKILSPLTIEDYETVFTGKSTADFTDPNVYRALVGDFNAVKFPNELDSPALGGRLPGVISVSSEISFTFVQALRDVVADFQNNRTNPLLTLLKSKSGAIDAKLFMPITDLVKNLNTAIEELPDVKEIRSDIKSTIMDAAGETYSPSSLSIRSDLSDEADKLFQSLKLYVGESEEGYEGAIHELSLGGANLIYLTLKLLEFKYQKAKQSFANFLLIEEPEAHIHTHIQKTLFDRLNYTDTQIIYTTHSSHISEVSNVENINILGRNGNVCEAYQPSSGLGPDEIGNIQRYLDAVRSNLLFAKSIVLVEGDAEEILIPILVKKTFGLSLDELGISLINIRSTGFENVAVLFHQDRIRKRCSIIADLDATFFDTTPDPLDLPEIIKAKAKALSSQTSGANRQARLNEFCNGNPWLKVFYAPHTFEVDFIRAGKNVGNFISTLNTVYKSPQTIALAKAELLSLDPGSKEKRALSMAENAGKGWFAILLGKVVDHQTIIPNYIVDALFFAQGTLSKEILSNIVNYRLRLISERSDEDKGRADQLRIRLVMFANDEISFVEFRKDFYSFYLNDPISSILARL